MRCIEPLTIAGLPGAMDRRRWLGLAGALGLAACQPSKTDAPAAASAPGAAASSASGAASEVPPASAPASEASAASGASSASSASAASAAAAPSAASGAASASSPSAAASKPASRSARMARPPARAPMATAASWQAFRESAARRIVAANPQGSYMGKPQDILLAIPVLEIELTAEGDVRRIVVVRYPRQARDTVQIAMAAIRRAAPFGDVTHLPKPWKFIETFLFNDARQFKPRSLDR